MKKSRIFVTMAFLPLKSEKKSDESILLSLLSKSRMLLLLCAVLTGCNLIGEDEPDLNNLPPDSEKNYKIDEDGVLTRYTGQGGDVRIPDGVIAISMEVFSNKSITSVIIPEGVKIIGNWAFESCKKLTSVTLPSSLFYIMDGAFRECPSLTSIVIPPSVKMIGNGVFSECTGLRNVTVGWGIPLYSGRYSSRERFDLEKLVGITPMPVEDDETYIYSLPADVFEEVELSSTTLKVPGGGVKARYDEVPVWGDFGRIEEDANIAPPANGIAMKPDARSAYDADSRGVYKGVIAGSTGSFVIDLQGDKPQTTLFYNNIPIHLDTWMDGVTIASGQPVLLSFSGGYVLPAEMTGQSYQWHSFFLLFEVEADGSNPAVSATHDGSGQMISVVVKETSTELVEVYEGTYSGTMEGYSATNGTFNVIRKGAVIRGLINSNQAFSPYHLSGSVSDSNFTAIGKDGQSPPLNIAGAIGNGTVSGSYSHTFDDRRTGSGTFSGKRKW